jgi:hypothetical protein
VTSPPSTQKLAGECTQTFRDRLAAREGGGGFRLALFGLVRMRGASPTLCRYCNVRTTAAMERAMKIGVTQVGSGNLSGIGGVGLGTQRAPGSGELAESVKGADVGDSYYSITAG